jgi:hypothetical protein
MTTTVPIRHPLALRTALLALFLAAGLLFTAVRASAEQQCSDFTTDNRPCTAMEEYGYCLTNASDSYDDCTEGGGFFREVACGLAFNVDFLACTSALLVDMSGLSKLVG